tara:strand:- start:1672 stop:2070 length:399 start_codon:yes stop_codon:yes gene_type:complete
MNLHDLIKLYKHGFSKVTDHASREIRFKRLSRLAAINLVKNYELNPVEHLNLFQTWLGIKDKSLDFILNQFRNKKYWDFNDDQDKWLFSGLSTKMLHNESQNDSNTHISFTSTDDFSLKKQDKYITFGKGWY